MSHNPPISALQVGPLSAAPYLPDGPQAWAELERCFTDLALFEYCCGLGRAVAGEELREILAARELLQLWRLPTKEPGATALAVYSLHTSVPRVGVYGLPSGSPLWPQAIASLCAYVFGLSPPAAHATLHLPVDPDEGQETALFLQGFAPYEIDPDYKPPWTRQIYGLSRQMWEQFRQA